MKKNTLCINSGRILPAMMIFIALFLNACSDSSNNNSRASNTPSLGIPGAANDTVLPVPAALVEGPIDGAPVLVGTFIDLPGLGYTTETEYLVSGKASAYVNVNELQTNGKWEIAADQESDYKTRVVVIRPTEAAAFNGTVIVEWLNVSAGFDSPPDWLQAHTEITRSGFAWVGVSAQKVGVDALLDGRACSINPSCADPDRYASLALDHPGDFYSYDIFSQVAQALRTPGATSLLGNLEVSHIIAAGESQSAGRMLTYVNAFAPVHAMFDGYLVHSRTAGSAGLQQEGIGICDVAIPTPDIVNVRDDLGVPTIMLQTETDLFILGSYPDNQDDSDNFRLWEVAGSAHADLYTFLLGRQDDGTNPSFTAVSEEQIPVNFPPFTVIDCTPFPVNSGPQRLVVNAAFRALHNWIVDDIPAPRADRLEVAGNPAAFVKDEFGNTQGGVRTPYVDSPIAILEGEGQPQSDFSGVEGNCDINLDNVNFCFLSGTTSLFNANTLSTLYQSNDAYIEALNKATDEAVSKGFLLPEDAALIKANAANSNIFENAP